MKLNLFLVAMFQSLVLQFRSAPHYVEETVKVTGGHTVTFLTNGPGATLGYTKEEKKDGAIYSIKVGVPAGPALRVPASCQFASNDDRDVVAAAIKEAYSKVENTEGNDLEIVIPDGGNTTA